MLDEQRGSQLFKVLGQQGYDLHLYGSAPLYSPEFDRTAFADVREQLHQGRRAGAARDSRIVASLRKDIRASQAAHTPWFGFVFLDSTHAPYHIPKGYPPLATPMAREIDFLKFGPDHDPTPELNRYRTAVHYADSPIARCWTICAHRAWIRTPSSWSPVTTPGVQRPEAELLGPQRTSPTTS
jgi:membrane-anchored protein YejM (alkaline phosphatase superfamily)